VDIDSCKKTGVVRHGQGRGRFPAEYHADNARAIGIEMEKSGFASRGGADGAFDHQRS
jgi:hypothetical protein